MMGSPGLAIFALIMIAAMLVIVGIVLVLAAIVVGAIAFLVSAGIISSSLIVGLKTRSISKGVRLAIFQICLALGAIGGLGIAAVVKIFAHSNLAWASVETLGLLCGMAIGMIVGGSLSALLKILQQKWFPERGFEVVQFEVVQVVKTA